MDHLVTMPRNPIPLGSVAGTFAGRDGVHLRYARWTGALKYRKGTVCLFGGRTEYIEKYFETVGDLRRRGFAVATMDWRGQGGSERLLTNSRKGHVEDFADYEADLEIFMREIVLPDSPPPYFALAHSMGAAVLLSAARARDCWFARMVLSAPLIGVAGLAASDSLVGGLAEAAVLLGLGDAYVPGGSGVVDTTPAERSVVTSDPLRLARNLAVIEAAPQLGLGSPTLGWTRAAFAAMRLLQSDAFAPDVHVPVLMVAAGGDRVVSNLKIEQLAARLKTGSQIVVRNAHHEILQERDELREQFWAAFDAFVPGSEPRLSRTTRPVPVHATGDPRTL